MATTLGKLLVNPVSGTASAKTQTVTSWIPSPGNRSDITQNILYTATKPDYTDITSTVSYIIPGIGAETHSAHEELITTNIADAPRLYYVPEYNQWVDGVPYYAWTTTSEFESGNNSGNLYYTDKPFATITTNTHISDTLGSMSQVGVCTSKHTSLNPIPYIYDSALAGGSIWFSSNEAKLSWAVLNDTIANFEVIGVTSLVLSDTNDEWITGPTIQNDVAISSDPGATGRYFCQLTYTCDPNATSYDKEATIQISGAGENLDVAIRQSAFNLEVTNSDSFNIPLETYSTTTVNTDRPNWTSEVSA